MEQNTLKFISKKLSYTLRHHPESIGLVLDKEGWANVSELLDGLAKDNVKVSMEDLQEVVAQNDKKRFAFSEDFKKIRASQGHSIDIELGYGAKTPPEILYHGTSTKSLDSIKEQGLLKQNRHHVHLSADKETAQKVGSRHGKPVVLIVNAKEMQQAGFEFFISENGVWLTETVPVDYLVF